MLRARSLTLIAGVATAALVLTACGSSSTPSTSAPSSGAAVSAPASAAPSAAASSAPAASGPPHRRRRRRPGLAPRRPRRLPGLPPRPPRCPRARRALFSGHDRDAVRRQAGYGLRRSQGRPVVHRLRRSRCHRRHRQGRQADRRTRRHRRRAGPEEGRSPEPAGGPGRQHHHRGRFRLRDRHGHRRRGQPGRALRHRRRRVAVRPDPQGRRTQERRVADVRRRAELVPGRRGRGAEVQDRPRRLHRRRQHPADPGLPGRLRRRCQGHEPSIKIDDKYITEPPDFSGFNAPDKGQTIAKGMYDGGADVVYAAAGGSGNGVFKAAQAGGTRPSGSTPTSTSCRRWPRSRTSSSPRPSRTSTSRSTT